MSQPLTKTVSMEIVYGFEESNLTICCEGSKFHVHRDVISQASKVWGKMLTSGYAESFTEIVTLNGDAPEDLKQSLDIIYHVLNGEAMQVDSPVSNTQLQVFLDKYDLKGVSAYLQREAAIVQSEKVILDSRVEDVASAHRKHAWEQVCSSGATLPGRDVYYSHYPPIGTRVVGTGHFSKFGVVIANDEDNGSEIGVRWNGGGESHNLHCGKKGGFALKYA